MIKETIASGETESSWIDLSDDLDYNSFAAIAPALLGVPNLATATTISFKVDLGDGVERVLRDQQGNKIIISNFTSNDAFALDGVEFANVNKFKIVLDKAESSDEEFVITTRQYS